MDIPLQQARQAQAALVKQLGQGNALKNSDYAALLDSLRAALKFALSEQ